LSSTSTSTARSSGSATFILGADCEILQYAVVNRWAVLGDRVTVHPFAVIGGDSQDLKFEVRSESWVRVGSGTRIRVGVTINRSTNPGGVTTVGKNCLLMACCHVTHDCAVGREVVIANAVLLAGHVTVSPGETFGARLNCVAAKMRIPTCGKNGFIDLWTTVDVTKPNIVELGDGSTVVLVPGCRMCAAEPDSEVNSPEFPKVPGVGWNIAAC
jgi:acyl-ACP--UDP-N-acetylglucosamine O-acyltransferase